MASLRDPLAPHRYDALAAWAVTFGLVVAAGRFLRAGEPDWAVFATLLVAGAASAHFESLAARLAGSVGVLARGGK
jgi:hypothetical protein